MHALEAIVATLNLRLEKDHHVPPEDEGPRAAVAVILREQPGGAELFFIQRAEHPRDPWSGHIAFPGGRREPGDVSLLATAIRETLEEVGVDLEGAHFVGRLPDVPSPVASGRTNAKNAKNANALVVTPYVFALRDPVVVRPSMDEVADTLWVPVGSLARSEGKGTFRFSWEGREHDLPCFRLPPGEQRVLWGMTYRMLATMFDALGTPLD